MPQIMRAIPRSKNLRIASWASQPFKEFITRIERLEQILRLSIRGISVLQRMPQLVEVLGKIRDNSDDQVVRGMLEQFKQEAELAQQEIDEGFPLLYAQAIIVLWSALETAVRLFLTKWLQYSKTAMDADIVQKLRVRIGEYERLEGEDRFFYILDRLEQELSTPLRSDVTRFEIILEPFGLSGPVDKDVQRNIFELNQVRNALVHRSGIADRRLIDACPWLGLTISDAVKIDEAACQKYFESVGEYAAELLEVISI